MAEETVVAPAENEILAILKSLAPKIEGIEARLAALEAEEAEEAKMLEEVAVKEDTALPTPEVVPVAAKKDDAEVVEAPAYVADMKARLDAAEQELSKIKANADRADDAEQAAEFAKAQKKADDVEQAYGDSAPRPLQGESLIAYKQRLLAKHLPRSAMWKDAAVSSINDLATLSKIEDQVYADSLAAASQCVGMAEGVLIPFTRDVGTGRKITEFRGKESFVKSMAPARMGSKIHRQTYN